MTFPRPLSDREREILDFLLADPDERLAPLRTQAETATVTVGSRVAFATAVDGIEVAGTAHRMDGVPVPLRAPRESDRPSIEDVLAAIEERL